MERRTEGQGEAADAMGMKGVVAAWEVEHIRLIRARGGGMLVFEILETGL